MEPREEQAETQKILDRIRKRDTQSDGVRGGYDCWESVPEILFRESNYCVVVVV